jgi:Cu(I)/Ag(I) efflux system protein CusF
MKLIRIVVMAGAITIGSPVLAADTDHDSHHAPSAAEMSRGEIRKVDKDAGKLTIRHGELKNLGMPPMTMNFRVSDTAMLDQVKVGDKVMFVVEKIDGLYTVTKLELEDAK